MLRVALLIIGYCINLAAGNLAHAEPVSQPQEIQWNTNRQLSWDDFLGAVDLNAPTENVALTAASLSWSYQYEIEHDASSCFYRITDIHALASFSQGDSWVKPDHRNAAVLNHEQGHFDLTQIYKLILDERAHHLIGARDTCEGDTVEEASEFAEKKAAEQVETVFKAVWQKYSSTQETYDEQTRHGILIETQNLWTEKIHRGLRREQWNDFIDERK